MDMDASSLISPREDAFEEELNLRVDKIVADRERLQLLCRYVYCLPLTSYPIALHCIHNLLQGWRSVCATR